MGSTAEWIRQRKESMNLKIDRTIEITQSEQQRKKQTGEKKCTEPQGSVGLKQNQ